MNFPWTGTVIPFSAALRAVPHKDAKRPYAGIVKDLTRGTRVTVVSQHGAWLHVKTTCGTQSITGYIAKELVRFICPASNDKPTRRDQGTTRSRLVSNPSVARRSGVVHSRDNTTVSLRPSRFPAIPRQAVTVQKKSILDGLQQILDLVGFIPGLGDVADLMNAGISAARGNYLDAALSLISLIPGVGDAIGKGAKYALKFADAKVARKALEALQGIDWTGFFERFKGNKKLAIYAESLRRSLNVLTEKLAHVAGAPIPHFAMASVGKVPAGSLPKKSVLSKKTLVAVAKQGDHVFNRGLTKLALRTPSHTLLAAAFKKFQNGIMEIERKGGFNITANKGAHGADLNSKLFGEALGEVRNAWEKLNGVLVHGASNPQHRAEAVLWTTQALERLRTVSFDGEAVLAGMKGLSLSDARKLKDQIKATSKQLDDVFEALVKDVQKLMPHSSSIGQSMAGR